MVKYKKMSLNGQTHSWFSGHLSVYQIDWLIIA